MTRGQVEWCLMLLGGFVLGGLMMTSLASTQVRAVDSLKIQPLIYNEKLSKGEIKRGYIDVSNPTNQKLRLRTSVEAFRQVDDEGNLEFYESEAIASGITADYERFTLQPQQAIRMVFEIDGSKLPSGDVFASLFVRTDPSQGEIQPSIRLGTLLIIENGTPASRDAEVTDLKVNFWQLGGQLRGGYSIKNTAPEGQTTGFMPTVDIALKPFGGRFDHRSSLVQSGRERVNDFSYDTKLAGLYRLEITHGSSTQSAWVLLLPTWAVVVLGMLIAAGVVAWYKRARLKRIYRRRR